jgi:membrane protease YdiL (CAAX protease family)
LRPIDLAGIPAGVATQLVGVPLLYWPLRQIWPDAFSQSDIDERAKELADKAGGATTVLLVLVVVVGAPLVEELVYRGLLQRALQSVVGGAGALVLGSMWFSLIHLSPVEYPGLLLAGLVFGAWLTFTGRIGGAILTHAAFNATGLILAFR